MSQLDIREVRLEIVRPGKPHNQLLSPLTPYMALCGEGSPITFHVELEHHQLLTRLERLRYVTRSGQKIVPIPARLREAEVGELGNEVGRIFSKIETLSTELARAQGGGRTEGAVESIVHLRLLVSGSELSLIPFEIATAPLAYPGEGLEFCLQASLPVVVTREIRRGRPVPVSWNPPTPPKVLVIYAEPEGMTVPAQAHIQAIRAALEPWIRYISEKERGPDEAENERKRLPLVKNRLRVLPNASIDSIYKTCAEEKFTHVHILAHGDTYEHAGDVRFGVALCGKDSPQEKEVVSGKRLAKALQAEHAHGCGRSDPLVVTLATCDSGNQATVLVPGGSIAYDLHVEGIPWIFASQFPLTKNGSVRMAEMLYPRLFRGDDPRQVLVELRRQLYQSGRNDHDWASVVAYAILPRDFVSQVSKFRSRQIKQAINVGLERADAIADALDTESTKEAPGESNVSEDERRKQARASIQSVIDQVEVWLSTWWCARPTGDSVEDHLLRAEISGMHGTTYKRVALLLEKVARNTKEGLEKKEPAEGKDASAGKDEPAGKEAAEKEEKKEKKEVVEKKGAAEEKDAQEKEIANYYRKSRDHYRVAMEEAAATGLKYYWSATQYLALQAARGLGEDLKTFELARALATHDITSNVSDDVKAWAYATLAELMVIGIYHSPPSKEVIAETVATAVKQVEEYCDRIVKLKGPRSFHVGSTLRQFRRYLSWKDERWDEIVAKAIKILAPPGSPEEFDYPEDD